MKLYCLLVSGAERMPTTVDGRIVVRKGVFTTVDETTLRAEIADLIGIFRSDFNANATRMAPAIAYLLDALSRLRDSDVGPSRLLDEGLMEFRP